MMVGLVVGLVVAVVLVVFGAQNAQPINLHFFGWDSSAFPLALVLGAALLLGMMLSFLLSIPGRIHRMRERRAAQRGIEEQREAVPMGPSGVEVLPDDATRAS